jgi:hypothetical protein
MNGDGAQSGSEGSKHTSTTITTSRTVSGGVASPVTDKTVVAALDGATPVKAGTVATAATTPAITIQKPFSPPGALPSPAPASLALPPASASSLSSSGSSTSSAQRKGKKR